VEQLSGLDGAFLAMETRSVFGSVCIVDALASDGSVSGMTLQHLTKVIESRLPLAPLFRRRLVTVPFGLDQPDLTGKSIRKVLSRVLPGAPGPVEAFKVNGADLVVADTLGELVEGMNRLTPGALLDLGDLERQIVARDRELGNTFNKDAQITAIHGARAYRGDKLIRTAAPHRILDPKAGPLIAVKLHILTRKTLGGLQTDLTSRVIRADGSPLPGLYAAGRAAGRAAAGALV